MFRKSQNELVDKLKQLLRMLKSRCLKMYYSQIVLDHGQIDSNSKMEEVPPKTNSSGIVEKPVSSRKRHRSLTGPRTNLSSRQSLNFDSDSNNNDEEKEDVVNQNSQMLAILREEKRKSIIPPPLLSPALSASTFKSPPRPRTPGPASRTMLKKAGHRDVLSTSTFNKKSLGVSSKTDRRQTVGGISTDKMSGSQARTVSGYHNDNDWIPSIQELDPDLGTARSSRSEPKKKIAKVVVTTGVIVKEEKQDDGYELIAPSYDAINDVEIVASIHPCPTCNKEFDSRGKMKAHVSKAHPDKQPVKHFMKSHAVSRKTVKSKSSYNCWDCCTTFSSRSELIRHKSENCQGKSGDGTSMCKHCNAVLANRRGLGHHLKHNCPVLKGKEKKEIKKRKSLKKIDRKKLGWTAI